jgi:hypothetical protein
MENILWKKKRKKCFSLLDLNYVFLVKLLIFLIFLQKKAFDKDKGFYFVIINNLLFK